jgi:multidrug resistance protein, MATE family
MFNKKTVRDVLVLALPAIGEMILYMMIGVFDTMMVGKYGGNIAVSSVGLSSEILYSFTNIFVSIGISVGVTSLVARRVGAKEYHLAEEYATLGLLAGLLIAVAISSIFHLFSSNILKFAGASREVVSLGTVYIKIVSVGILFNMLTSIFNAILRGYGNTRTPLMASVLINVINISLDWVLIFGRLGLPELGVRGAAIATLIAQMSGFLFIAVYSFKYSKLKPQLKYVKQFRPHMFKELLRLSIPSSLQEGAFSISRLASTLIIMQLGTVSFAANQITTTIESLSFMPGWGVAIAATTLVGHKIGEKNYTKAREYANTCIALGIGIMFLCSLLFLTLPTFLINLFITKNETEVIRLGARCLMVASIAQPFMAVSMIVGGSLKGSGDTRTPFFVSFISSWLIRLPLMLYFIYYLRVPVIYVWVITTIQWIFDGTLLFILFRRRFNKLVYLNKQLHSPGL